MTTESSTPMAEEPILKLPDFTAKIGRTVAALTDWEVLHYTGHFIDADPEMRQRIDAAEARTRNILKEWNVSIQQIQDHLKLVLRVADTTKTDAIAGGNTDATGPTSTSRQAHTSGPWQLVDSGFNMRGYGQPVAICEYGQLNLVAGIFGDVNGGTAVAEANACLIAASPELLGALRGLVDAIGSNSQDLAFSYANQVLAKAEGRSL